MAPAARARPPRPPRRGGGGGGDGGAAAGGPGASDARAPRGGAVAAADAGAGGNKKRAAAGGGEGGAGPVGSEVPAVAAALASAGEGPAKASDGSAGARAAKRTRRPSARALAAAAAAAAIAAAEDEAAEQARPRRRAPAAGGKRAAAAKGRAPASGGAARPPTKDGASPGARAHTHTNRPEEDPGKPRSIGVVGAAFVVHCLQAQRAAATPAGGASKGQRGAGGRAVAPALPEELPPVAISLDAAMELLVGPVDVQGGATAVAGPNVGAKLKRRVYDVVAMLEALGVVTRGEGMFDFDQRGQILFKGFGALPCVVAAIAGAGGDEPFPEDPTLVYDAAANGTLAAARAAAVDTSSTEEEYLDLSSPPSAPVPAEDVYGAGGAAVRAGVGALVGAESALIAGGGGDDSQACVQDVDYGALGATVGIVPDAATAATITLSASASLPDLSLPAVSLAPTPPPSPPRAAPVSVGADAGGLAGCATKGKGNDPAAAQAAVAASAAPKNEGENGVGAAKPAAGTEGPSQVSVTGAPNTGAAASVGRVPPQPQPQPQQPFVGVGHPALTSQQQAAILSFQGQAHFLTTSYAAPAPPALPMSPKELTELSNTAAVMAGALGDAATAAGQATHAGALSPTAATAPVAGAAPAAAAALADAAEAAPASAAAPDSGVPAAACASPLVFDKGLTVAMQQQRDRHQQHQQLLQLQQQQQQQQQLLAAHQAPQGQQQLWALGGMTTGMGVNVSSAMGVHQAAYPPPPHQAPHVFHQQAAFGTAQIGHARSPTGVVPDAGAVAMAAGTVGATPAGMGASVGGVNVAQQQSAVYNGALNIMFNNPSAVAAMQQQLGVGVGASVAGATQHQQPGQQLLTMQQPVNDFSSAMAAGMSSAAGGAGVPFGLGLPHVYSAGNLSDTVLGVSPFARATSAALQTAGGGRGIAVTPTSMEQYSPKDASLDYKSWQREGLVVDGTVRGKGAPGVADEAGSGGGAERKRGRGKARLFDPSPTSSKRQRQLATERRRQVASGYGAATGTARAAAKGRGGGGNAAGGASRGQCEKTSGAPPKRSRVPSKGTGGKGGGDEEDAGEGRNEGGGRKGKRAKPKGGRVPILTWHFMHALIVARGSRLSLADCAEELPRRPDETTRNLLRRLYDVANLLEGICLVSKTSAKPASAAAGSTSNIFYRWTGAERSVLRDGGLRLSTQIVASYKAAGGSSVFPNIAASLDAPGTATKSAAKNRRTPAAHPPLPPRATAGAAGKGGTPGKMKKERNAAAGGAGEGGALVSAAGAKGRKQPSARQRSAASGRAVAPRPQQEEKAEARASHLRNAGGGRQRRKPSPAPAAEVEPPAASAGTDFGPLAVSTGFDGLTPSMMAPAMDSVGNKSSGNGTNEDVLEDAAATLLKIASTDDLLALGAQHFSAGGGGSGHAGVPPLVGAAVPDVQQQLYDPLAGEDAGTVGAGSDGPVRHSESSARVNALA